MVMTIIFYVVHDTGKQYQVLPHRLSCADRVIMEVCCYNGLGGTCVVLVGTKAFSVSHISGFQEMGLIQPPWPFLSSKRQVQTIVDQGSRWGVGGRNEKTRELQSRNNSTALGQDPGSHSRDTHNNISILYT